MADFPEEAYRKNTNFQRKLDENDRIAIIAMYRSGIRREILALAFGVDKRTIGHMANPQSVHYIKDRKRYETLGMERVLAEIVTEEMKRKVVDATVSLRTVKTETVSKNLEVSPRSANYAGIHTVRPDQCAYSHRIEIKYRDEGDDPAGWYVRDMESLNPELWFHNGPASLKSSKACYDAALLNMVDEQ